MNLTNFVKNWQSCYERRINRIPLLNAQCVSGWNNAQVKFFVRAFQHARGHFGEFLWHLGITAPDPTYRNIIIHNITEEFGEESGLSHEHMYLQFAEYLGVDLHAEIREETTYRPHLRSFNQGHLRWLRSNRWAAQWGAYAAYEKLDNVDYARLYEVARVLAGDGPLQFFEVHREVAHFEATEAPLSSLWESDPNAVADGFSFIADHQVRMWSNLNHEVALRANRKKT